MGIKQLALLLLAMLVLSGCGAQKALIKSPPLTPEAILHANLDRFDHWTSLFATLKLRVSVHDTNFTAKGNVMYLAGERYEVGFEKPYNRYLGTFYVTPTNFIYFDTHSTPTTYDARDTTQLSRFIPLAVPNWDPRDLLPFPISGRSGGFQTDSIRSEGGKTWIYGSSDQVSYALALDERNGTISEEQVLRAGRELLLKKYERIKKFDGWPVPTRTVVMNPAGDVRFTWSLGRVDLKLQKPAPNESISPSK